MIYKNVMVSVFHVVRLYYKVERQQGVHFSRLLESQKLVDCLFGTYSYLSNTLFTVIAIYTQART